VVVKKYGRGAWLLCVLLVATACVLVRRTSRTARPVDGEEAMAPMPYTNCMKFVPKSKSAVYDLHDELNRPRITRLRVIRRKLGFTQKEMEQELHMTHTVYAMLEQGRISDPYPYMRTRLEEYFNVSWERLMEKVPDKGEA
jgi:DNA-binding XRE family transcriptional regulator